MKSRVVLNIINMGKILCKMDAINGFVVEIKGTDRLEWLVGIGVKSAVIVMISSEFVPGFLSDSFDIRSLDDIEVCSMENP